MLIVIDNYDSFTYNLVQALGMLGADIKVVRNDKATVEEMASWKPDLLLVSPGPGTPNEAGISVAAICHFAGRIPVLGVCL
ncbi:MAG: anthranilate/aminodeoxychorismate synthase component II, partial [Deltaproteobacteria bacterium]|nr:anthranilate/aminodeoxychorismate synthase component II [Deltaproteobacteria bacterium]